MLSKGVPTRAATAAAAALCAAGVAPTLKACRRVDASVASRAKRAILAWQSISPNETTISCVCALRSSPVANWIGGRFGSCVGSVKGEETPTMRKGGAASKVYQKCL